MRKKTAREPLLRGGERERGVEANERGLVTKKKTKKKRCTHAHKREEDERSLEAVSCGSERGVIFLCDGNWEAKSS
jgi:hypothetical protein